MASLIMDASLRYMVISASGVEECLTPTSSFPLPELGCMFISTGIWTGGASVSFPTETRSCDANTSLHIQSRLLSLRSTGVERPSSASIISRLLLWSSSVDEASTSVSGNPSMTGVGMYSTSLSWKATRFTGRNIRLGARFVAADTCRRGKGLLRRML